MTTGPPSAASCEQIDPETGFIGPDSTSGVAQLVPHIGVGRTTWRRLERWWVSARRWSSARCWWRTRAACDRRRSAACPAPGRATTATHRSPGRRLRCSRSRRTRQVAVLDAVLDPHVLVLVGEVLRRFGEARCWESSGQEACVVAAAQVAVEAVDHPDVHPGRRADRPPRSRTWPARGPASRSRRRAVSLSACLGGVSHWAEGPGRTAGRWCGPASRRRPRLLPTMSLVNIPSHVDAGGLVLVRHERRPVQALLLARHRREDDRRARPVRRQHPGQLQRHGDTRGVVVGARRVVGRVHHVGDARVVVTGHHVDPIRVVVTRQASPGRC